MDDETYVPLDTDNMPGKNYYSQRPGFETPLERKLKQKTKFYQKFLVWQAIDQNGNVSKPYITNGTINKKVYLENCLKKRLLPLIQEHLSVGEARRPNTPEHDQLGCVRSYLIVVGSGSEEAKKWYSEIDMELKIGLDNAKKIVWRQDTRF